MSEEEVIQAKKRGPFVDYSYQFNLVREKVEQKIFAMMCEISKRLHEENSKTGILVVLGAFNASPDYQVPGMRLLGSNSIEKYINVMFPQFEETVLKIFESGNDGAIIVDQSGQLLGTGVYLTVDDPSVDIPEGAGTRHISAASFSTRDDVVATLTLSEETLAVRLWKNGAFVEQFYPSEVEE